MKKILTLVLVTIAFAASAQVPTGYTGISSRYDWLAGKFRALNLPVITDTVLQAGQYALGATAIVIKSGDTSLYTYTGQRWKKVGGGELYRFGVEDDSLSANRSVYMNEKGFTFFTQKSNGTGRNSVIIKGDTLYNQMGFRFDMSSDINTSYNGMNWYYNNVQQNAFGMHWTPSDKHIYLSDMRNQVTYTSVESDGTSVQNWLPDGTVQLGIKGQGKTRFGFFGVAANTLARVHITPTTNIPPLMIDSMSAPSTTVNGMIYRDATDGHLYFRVGGQWVQMDNASSTGGTFGGTDARATANRHFSLGDTYDFRIDSIKNFYLTGEGGYVDRLSILQTESSLRSPGALTDIVTNDSYVKINAPFGYLNLNTPDLRQPSLPSSTDATDSMVVWRPATGKFGKRAISGGGATPTLQQVLTAGSTLTSNNTINIGDNEINIQGVNGMVGSGIDVGNSVTRIYQNNGAGAVGEVFTEDGGAVIRSGTGAVISSMYVGYGLAKSVSNDGSGKSSILNVYPDTIKLEPYKGNLIIDTLNTTSVTTSKLMMVHDTLTGKVWRTPIPSGGISGLTTNYIPIATSSSTLGNSHLNETSGTINITGAGGTDNTTLNFGANYGKSAITLYDGGPLQRYGWSLQAYQMQFFAPSDAHFAWYKGGDYQTTTTNEIMRLDNTTGRLGIGVTAPSTTLDVNGNARFRSLSAPSGTVTPVVIDASGYIYAGASTASVGVAGTSQTMARNTEYRSLSSSLATFTLPTDANSSVDDIVTIQGVGTGLFKVAQPEAPTAIVGTSTTTVGTGGYMQSQSRYDRIVYKKIASNTWTIVNQRGTFTTL